MKLRTMILAGLVACLALPVSSQTFTSIYSFRGGSAGDGAQPQGGLINRGGTLYGTTSSGGGTGCGGQGCGTVFALSQNGGGWTERVIYSFAGGSDGANPVSGLLNVMLNFSGKFYGTTQFGGGTGCGGAGCGTIFTLSPPTSVLGRWTETVVYSFAGGNDGEQPVAQLVDISGTLYGVTATGGGSGCFQNTGCGTVFSFNPATRVERVVHAFDGADGSNPYGGLLNIGNFLYGTTYRGGAGTGCVLGFGCGTAFNINETTGVLSVLHSFSAAGSDGASPQATLIDVGGTLYGTTNLDGTGGCAPPYGCGTVFAMDPDTGVVTPLHEFTGGTDGQHPTAPMIQMGGLLYGTTQGGITPNTGAVFQIDPTTGDERVLYEFSSGGSDGAGAIAPLLNLSGTFYSTTVAGGQHDYGTVYSITP